MTRKILLGLALLSCVAVRALAQQFPDPCQSNAKISASIGQSTPTTLITGATARKNYICSIGVVGSDAESLSLIEGSGTNCASTPLALIGSLTAASGLSLAANGSFVLGNGSGTVAAGTHTNYNVCLLQSGSGRVSGVLMYVQQ